MPLHLSLIIGEEESLVFLQRAAQRASELIQIEFLRRGSEEAACVQVCIAEELEQRPVEVIGPRLSRHQNGRTGACPIFRGVVKGQDLEFLDGIDGRENGDAARGQFVVVVAVEQPICAVGA